MKVSELMEGITPDPMFSGFVTADNMVLAVGLPGQDSTEDDYEVIQTGIEGVDPQLSPVTKDKQYIRTGVTTLKTGTQRGFKVTGDRYIGDKFQDYCFSHKIVHGSGQDVVVPCVYFCILTGRGEKGMYSIIVNSDGGGKAGETSTIDVSLTATGASPEEYTYTPTIRVDTAKVGHAKVGKAKTGKE